METIQTKQISSVTILIYIHVGQNLVNYIIDSIYQTLLINKKAVKIYVLLSDNLIVPFHDILQSTDIDETVITTIPISILETSLMNDASNTFINYRTIVSKYALSSFRDSFWINTTCRFFYIKEFVSVFLRNKKNVYHIENDVMLYVPFEIINKCIIDTTKGSIYMVKDSANRVVPSIMCFNDTTSLDELTRFITSTLKKSNMFVNDMEILSKFTKLKKFNFNPNNNSESLIFDGAAIGQYLGGVDPRNLGGTGEANSLLTLNNPSRGFVNETCEFNISKCNIQIYYDNGLKKYKITGYENNNDNNKDNDNDNSKDIVNLHIHSKQLYQFSSVFDILYDDIITGDRVLDLCDYIITTKEIDNFHKIKTIGQEQTQGQEQTYGHTRNTKIFIDSQNIVFPTSNLNGSKTSRFFVYTHILDYFIQILHHLANGIKEAGGLNTIVIYTHNSDNSFNEEHYKELEKFGQNANVKVYIFAQNINCNVYDNVKLLPIGIANSMWPHGALDKLYYIMSTIYNKRKTKNIYINMDKNTNIYRQEIIEKLEKLKNNFVISQKKKYSDYLIELGSSYFCLCMRGNGIDTHRFWESLYMNTIPVIINNADTDCELFVKHLRLLNVPFLELKDITTHDDITINNQSYFDKKLYQEIINKNNKDINNILCLDQLKINYYKF